MNHRAPSRRLARILAIGIVWSVLSLPAKAAPITITVLKDEPEVGSAVIAGSIDETVFNIEPDIFSLTVSGTWWAFHIGIQASQEPSGPSYDVFPSIRHIMGPHPGEGGGPSGPDWLVNNVNGVPGAGSPGPQMDAASVLHGPLGHFDNLSYRITDLNGVASGFTGTNNEFLLNIDGVHAPEPTTVLLLGSGLIWLVARRRSRDCKS